VTDFEWDLGKESLNFEKHGFDFTTASEIWVGPVVEKIRRPPRVRRDPDHPHRRRREAPSRGRLHPARRGSPDNLSEEGKLS
jgi:hypothetical protein